MDRDKPFPPTARRIRRALSEGDVPISHTVVRAAALLAALSLAGPLAAAMTARFRSSLERALLHPESARAISVGGEVMELSLPILCAAAAVAAMAGIAQTRGVVSFRGGSFFSGRGRQPFASRLGSALRAAAVAAALVLAVGYGLSGAGPEAARSLGNVRELPRAAAAVTSPVAWGAAVVLLAAAVLDWAAAYLAWLSRLRMSRRELEEERRQHEVAPHVRRARRQAHERLVRAPGTPPGDGG